MKIDSIFFSSSNDKIIPGDIITIAAAMSAAVYGWQFPILYEGAEVLVFAMNSKNTAKEPIDKEQYCDYWVRDPFRLIFIEDCGYFFTDSFFFLTIMKRQ